jgi:uncharacterized protein YecT (DUF1311 family)
MRLLITAIFMLAVCGFSHAADWEIPPASLNKTCGQKSSEVETLGCTDAAYRKSDAELNEVWRKVLAKVASGNAGQQKPQQWKDDLIAAEQAWVAFRDKDCNGARSDEYWGGSGRDLAVTSCLYEYTVERAKDLKSRYLED